MMIPVMDSPLLPFRTIGFIGTGILTAAVVRGIRSRRVDPTIHLSARSERLSLQLATELPNVVREASNAAVVEKADLVVLSVRPQQLEEALAGLRFRPDQVVVSFVATVPCSEIAAMVSPASQVCRVTPLPMIEGGRGPVVVSPSLPKVEALFDGIGDVVRAESESEIMAFGCAAALLSTFFEFEHTAANWLASTGVSGEAASLYVRSMFSALATTGLERRATTLDHLATGHETPGGLNEHARRSLRASGFFDRVDAVLTDLSTLTLRRRQ